MKKRTLTILIAVVLVVACAVGGTLAWLKTQTQEVTNTFTAGDINITLVESDSDDEGTDSNNNSYKMVPGSLIDKDPKVTVLTNSEKCYLFVTVTEANNLAKYIDYGIANGWTKVTGVSENVYYRIVDSNEMGTPFSVITSTSNPTEANPAVNDKVTVKSDLTKTDMDALDNSPLPTLTFKAYAVQYENIFDSTKTPNENAVIAWNEAKTTAQ